MSAPELYSLDQIGQFLLTEYPASHGISPHVHQQNTLLQRLVRVGAGLHAPAILGCQIVGSRGHGYADLTSDIDIAIIGYRSERKTVDAYGQALLKALLPAGIIVDWHVAPVLQGIRSIIPEEADDFIKAVSSEPRRSIGLYESGVYDTPDLRLGALAASAVIKHADEPQEIWEPLRTQHAIAYIGHRERVCAKLAVRLGLTEASVATAISRELWEERIRRYGLPEVFEEYYATQQAWLNTEEPHQAQPRTIALYERVVTRLGQLKNPNHELTPIW